MDEVVAELAVEVAAMSKENIYCDFVICSDIAQLPADLFLAKAKSRLQLTDNMSPERIAQRARWKTKGIPIRQNLERYWWELSTQGRIESDDLINHVQWILQHFRKDVRAGALLNDGYRYYLSVFWGASNGTGGGPLISPALSELLYQHKLPLSIGFYVAED